jgi:crossover junction endodeoxyribonuclease RuvC
MPKELPLFVDVSELRILGIDPGLASIGYGIIHETTALDYGAITTPKTLPLTLRLNGIHLDILELVRLYEPEAVAIEYPFFGRDNPNQGLVLQALGVIRMALAEAGLSEHILLHQSTIKSAIASYGADKKDIQAAVQSIFNLPTLPTPDDAADGKRDRLCSTVRTSLKHLLKTCAIPPRSISQLSPTSHPRCGTSGSRLHPGVWMASVPGDSNCHLN